MKIYIVHGTTGEYSDRTEWIVCAYIKKEDAERHVLAAQAHCPNSEEAYKAYFNQFRDGGRVMLTNPYDKKFHMDYTGTGYYLTETELLDSFEP